LALTLHPGDAAATPEALLEEALDLAEPMGIRAKYRFVVLLDEFPAVAGLGHPDILARMRNAFQNHRHTARLFLGSQAGLMAQLFGARNQPFFRFATMLDLPAIPEAAWRTYIRDRLASRRVEIDDVAVGRAAGLHRRAPLRHHEGGLRSVPAVQVT